MKLWIAMQKWALILSVTFLLPSLVWGGWFSKLIGIDKVLEVGRDITMAVVLYKFLNTWMPQIYILLLAGLAILSLYGAQLAMENFSKSWRQANEDQKISWKETMSLLAQYFPTLLIVAVGSLQGLLLGFMASTGLLETMGFLK